MCEPSTAAHGVGWWMASLAAFRASHIHWPASDSPNRTSATSGLRRAASSSSRERGGLLSRMSAGWSHREVFNGYGETFSDLASRLRQDCLRRLKSALRTRENASSSSLWLTPDVPNGGRKVSAEASPTGVMPDGRKVQVGLPNQAAMWPTPRAWDSEGGPDLNQPDRANTGSPSLNTTALMWPTPDASVMNDGESPETFLARRERLKAKGINGNGAGTPLTIASQLWPTPAARDFRSGEASEATHDRNSRPLNEVATLWATPRSHEVGEYQYSRGDKTKPVLTLTGQTASFRQAHPIHPVGGLPSKERRTLNPLFVEWLMGWPAGWTLLAWIDFACSETELSVWKRRMRSELLQLGLPDDPPVQRSLFA